MSNNNRNTGTIGRRRLLQAGAAGLGGIAMPWVARPAGAQSQLAGKTIGFSTFWVTAEWNRQQRQGVIDTAQKFGFKCIVLDAENHPDKEVSNLEDLVTRGVDAILINTYFTEAIAPAVREIDHAKIPIIVLSSALAGNVDWTVQLSADTSAAARTAGNYFVKRLNGKGDVIDIDGSSRFNSQPGARQGPARGHRPGARHQGRGTRHGRL
jgi:ribose transport system substrate-binding protein